MEIDGLRFCIMIEYDAEPFFNCKRSETMAKVTFIDADQQVKPVNIRNGQSILRAAKQGRIALRHKCGGQASCTTCKVLIHDQTGISDPLDIEIMRLGEDNIAKGMRLSCQTKVLKTVEVEIPEDPYKARIRALIAEQNK